MKYTTHHPINLESRSLRAALTSSAMLACAMAAGTANAEEIVRTLYAGQTLPVGTVTITTGTPGQVDFVLDDNNFCLTEIHVAVGALGTDIPLNKQGSPQIGRFPYQDYPDCEKSSGFQIAGGIGEGDNVAAHAKVQYGEEGYYESETAWPAGYNFTQTNWSTYVTIAPPLPEKHVFARAYIDLDGNGEWSPDSTDDPDSLIAELVDDNNSGFIDVGDKVYTNQYPIDLDANQRADFAVNEHTVTYVNEVVNASPGFVIKVSVAGGVITFGAYAGTDIDANPFSIESYSEGITTSIGTETLLVADGTGDNKDSLKAVLGKGPSQPEEAVPLAQRDGGSDDPFINIDFYLP